VTTWVARVRANPGRALLALALVLACALYASTLGRGLVGYDDGWLLHDNWIVQHASWSSLHTIFFDLDSPHRYVLSPEYLPVRDLSVMLDFAIWGHWYAGHHLTNLAIYLAAIVLWFRALDGYGIERTVAGLAVLIWAIHPSHAESVAWLAERKGLLGVMFAGAVALGHARFRAGGGAGWLGLAVACAVGAVWSKALAAFAILGLVGFELALPARRISWPRSLVSLAAIGMAAGLAFVPVMLLATRTAVVGTHLVVAGSRLAAVLGIHGFYVELGAMVVPNAVAYPIAQHGPSAIQVVLGAIVLAAAVAVAAIPRRGRWSPPGALRAAAVMWLCGWFPASHLAMPLQMVVVADRYALIPTLGLALAVAIGITRIPSRRAAYALVAVLVLAASIRTLDAQASWSDPVALWSRAVASSPDDPEAQSLYAQARGVERPELEAKAVAAGLARHPTPRLRMRQALLELGRGDRARAVAHMRAAAEAGDPTAMSDLARLLIAAGRFDDAAGWARRAIEAAPYSAEHHVTLGTALSAMHRDADAIAELSRAVALAPIAASRAALARAVADAVHRRAEVGPRP
jgi:protein O-mannosyl-transferase